MNNSKIRVLIVSYFPLNSSLSTGNTLINIFDGMSDRLEFANLYFKDGLPNDNLCDRYFHISEKQMIKKLFSNEPVGEELFLKIGKIDTSESYSYKRVRQLRWELFLLVQDLIGIFSNWKSENLDKFILDYKPDIIFGPLGRVPTPNNLMGYLHKKFSIPVITYPWDDHYSLKKFSFSPIYWARTIIERKAIRKCTNNSELLYTITEEMKSEYNNYFKKECKLLFKTYEFNNCIINERVNNKLKIVYLGNIGAGRWQVIAKVAKALSKINKFNIVAELEIYTSTPVSKRIFNKLNIEGTSKLKSAVNNSQVKKILNESDILLHVIPTRKKYYLQERLSFSTKIVDYFYAAKCILAVGGNTSTMKYLKKNDAAYIINENIELNLKKLLQNNDIILSYGKKAWDCGHKNHQKNDMQNLIYYDFLSVVSKSGR